MHKGLTRFCPFTILTVAVVIISSTVHGATPARTPFGAAWQTVDCKTFDVPAAVAAQSDCGYVTVPEQHGQPQGQTIQLGVVRTRSTSKTPAPDRCLSNRVAPADQPRSRTPPVPRSRPMTTSAHLASHFCPIQGVLILGN